MQKQKYTIKEIIKLGVFLTLSIFAFLSYSYFTRAQVPDFVNYQGRLMDSSGNPITSATTIQFSLYNHPTNGSPSGTPGSAGPLLWTETYDGSNANCQQITPGTDGIFAQHLGDCVPFPSYLDFTQEYYLGVKIGADAEATPRVPLSTHPYAFTSKRLYAENEDVYITTGTSGNIVIQPADDVLLYDTNASVGVAGEILSSTGSGIDWISPSSFAAGSLWDTDHDTGVQVEESADDDILRIDTAGSQRMAIDNTGNLLLSDTEPASLLNPGNLQGLLFRDDKFALRVGETNNNEWNDTNVGRGSFASGRNNIVSGNYSSAFGGGNNINDVYATALGRYHTVTGSYAVAGGFQNTAGGYASAVFGQTNQATDVRTMAWGLDNQATADEATAWGRNSVASGNYATSWGRDTQASGAYSTAFGYQNTASQDYGLAFGYQNTVSGRYATGWGGQNTVSGQYGTAWGSHNTASGANATAFGYHSDASGNNATAIGDAVANSYYMTAVGRFNVEDNTQSADTWVDTDYLFVVGNGSGWQTANRRNAFSILKNGSTTINAPIDGAVLTQQPTGNVNLAIATTGYVDNAISSNTPNTLYTADGTITSDRLVTFDGRYLNMEADGNNSEFTAEITDTANHLDSYITVSPGGLELDATNSSSGNIHSVLNITATGLDLEHGANALMLRDDMTIMDGIHHRGIEYHADYSANYTNRTLVDKEYVDTSIAAGNIYGTDGTLTGDRTVDFDDKRLTFSGSLFGADGEFYADGQTIKSSSTRFDMLLNETNTGYSLITASGSTFGHINNDGSGDKSSYFNANKGGLKIVDEIIERGVEYDADYSANYTNRTLVDKEYVDNAVSNGGLWHDGTNGYYSNTEGIIVGADQAETLSNAGFVLNAGDLFVEDELGVEGNIYTDGSFIAGATTTLSDGLITRSTSGDGNLTISTTGGTDGTLELDSASNIFILQDFNNGRTMWSDNSNPTTATAGLQMDPNNVGGLGYGYVTLGNYTGSTLGAHQPEVTGIDAANANPMSGLPSRRAYVMAWENDGSDNVGVRINAINNSGTGTGFVRIEATNDIDLINWGGDINISADDQLQFQDANAPALYLTQNGSSMGNDLLNNNGEIFHSNGAIGSTIGAGETSVSIVHALNALGTYVVNSAGSSSSPWAKTGTNISPATAGDDILLNAGETLSISDLTQGSIPFIGTGGLITQDNANLFWDSVNNNFGVGTNNPSTTLSVENGLLSIDRYLVGDIRNMYIPQKIWGEHSGFNSDYTEKVAPTNFNSATTEVFAVTALLNGNALVAYRDGGNSNRGTLKVYDKDGNSVISAVVFETGAVEHISATTLLNGNVLIAYADVDNSGYGTFVIYDQDGNQVKAPTVFNSGGTNNYIGATTLQNGNVLIAYTDTGNSGHGTFAIYDQDGNVVKAPTVFAAVHTDNVEASTLSNGNVFIAYRDRDNSFYGTFTIYDQDGNVVKSPTVISSNFVNYLEPMPVFSSGKIMIPYQGLGGHGFLTIYDNDGNQIKTPTQIGTGTMGHYIGATILTDGNVLMTYRDLGNSSHGAFVVYDEEGNQVKAAKEFAAEQINWTRSTVLTNGDVFMAYQRQQTPDAGKFVIYKQSGALFDSAVNINTNDEAGLNIVRNNDGLVASFTDANGTCTIDPTSTALICSSDASMKKDINDVGSAMDLISNLRGVTYHWNGEDAEDSYHYGFIAQELQQIIPELVSKSTNGKLAVNYGGLTPILTKGMQEQQAQLDKIELRLSSLENNGVVWREDNDIENEEENSELTVENLAELTELTTTLTEFVDDHENRITKLENILTEEGIDLDGGNIQLPKTLKIFADNLKVLEGDGKSVEFTINGKLTIREMKTDKLVVSKEAIFEGGVVYANEDLAGKAIIKRGNKKIKIKFKNKFKEKPFVTATVNNEFILYKVTNVSSEGFEIAIKNEADKDIEFTWQAVVVKR